MYGPDDRDHAEEAANRQLLEQPDPPAAAARWVRGSHRTAAHAVMHLGRRTLCGTHLGWGDLRTVADDDRVTRRCQRCVAYLERAAAQ